MTSWQQADSRQQIPEYFRSDGIQNPGSCTANPVNNQVAYKPGDFCSISTNHPDWFLLDQYGQRITVTSGGDYYRMDPANAGWREFFAARVMESQNQYGWSALFLDNVEAGLGNITARNRLNIRTMPVTRMRSPASCNTCMEIIHKNMAALWLGTSRAPTMQSGSPIFNI